MIIIPVSMASLTTACPVSRAASHGRDSPEGGTTRTSPGTRFPLATPSTSEREWEREGVGEREDD